MGGGNRSVSPVSSGDEDGSMSPLSPCSQKDDKANSEASTPQRQGQETPSTSDGPPAQAAQKITKRRAARACVSCRARKVRCDVVEGAPCGNCRWDNVDCIIQESRRRKKNIYTKAVDERSYTEAFQVNSIGLGGNPPVSITSAPDFGRVMPYNFADPLSLRMNGRPLAQPLFQQPPAFGDSALLAASSGANPWFNIAMMGENQPTPSLFPNPLPDARQRLRSILPPFIQDPSSSFDTDYTDILLRKYALDLPGEQLQSALLRSYVEFVNPYMPLLELNDFLNAINDRSGASGRVSLLLYQAVMFAASSFVDERYLREAGFGSRKIARKALFLKAKASPFADSGDFIGRIPLVQALLLMTYWYETPEDHKDTWHWMGIAISMVFTIGLYRDPADMDVPEKKKKLWKRIWWSCFMRDRMIALGMRRPTRIKEEDYDVSMLTMADFDIQPLPDDNELLGPDCAVTRNVGMQQLLATMCIEKAKLCICISHMLKTQYSILGSHTVRPGPAKSQMMLFPNKSLDNASIKSVQAIDQELVQWMQNLPTCCRLEEINQQNINEANKTLFVQQRLLHMVYYTTRSALHRPLWNVAPCKNANLSPELLQIHKRSQNCVRAAAHRLSELINELQVHRVTKYLPTTGVTVILPAVLIHLLDLASAYPDVQENAARNYFIGIQALSTLRENYAAAGFAIEFLESAVKRAEQALTSEQYVPQQDSGVYQDTDFEKLDKVLGPGINLAPSTPPADQSEFADSAKSGLYHNTLLGTVSEAVSHCNSLPQSASSSAVAGSPMKGQQTDGIDCQSEDWGQYLQFPAEGVNNSDGSFVDMFGGAKSGNSTSGMDWTQTLSMQSSDPNGSFELHRRKMDSRT
ncbi:fungal-specific transcription factor domain-containing protein [Lasiosphaeris hirsuta]|uniref:Fungal-specific transcription factor domain-containing protein n=1 Tax=Lasiosphaeris hirsuta TaxID=260670 RepID=A0AA40APS8_9PEZI|nr:fungal-specific transcription factor domain-containing protein [Lasiosphaeris hirsuta]